KRPRKHEDLNKQRDRGYIERFSCNGVLKILLNMEMNTAAVDLQHNLLHKRPDRFNVSDIIKAEIKKNLHLMPADIFRHILTLFFESLFKLGLNNVYFFLTDKDFAQVSAAQKVWPNAKIQICFWHLKKAIKKRLTDNTYPKVINYSSYSAHQVFEFIDIEFYPTPPSQMTPVQKKSFCFCPKELRPKILDMI
ncbi:16202_t:CDS:2, partial [Racocetra fulgida]